MKSKNLLGKCALVLSLSVMTSTAATFAITISIGLDAGGTTQLSGVINIADIPTIETSSSGFSGSNFSVESLSLANESVSQSWASGELMGYGLILSDDFGTLSYEGRLPLPSGVLGLVGPHDYFEGFEYEPTNSPPVGSLDVSDFDFLDDGSYTIAGGASYLLPQGADPSSSIGTSILRPITPIPEPSHSLMALIGLSFLLKRRR